MEPTREIAVTVLRPDSAAPGARALAAEVPVAISICGLGYAVMMATPADLAEFATGFAISERLIDDLSQIEALDVREEAGGMLVDLWLAEERRPLVLERVRHRVSESSCGLCGIDNLEAALRPLPRVERPLAVAPEALFAALAALRDHQPMNRATGAFHAAALCAPDGTIRAAFEDVGRHNAFDKVIGHAWRAGIDPADGFALLSARCSYELVEKAVLGGVRLLVTISAPTTLAVDRAREAGLTLVALARPDAMLVASDPWGLFGR